MKIICRKDILLKGVNIVLKAVPSKTTMPILECILINASHGDIRLTANDMELGIETIIEGIIERPGKIAIDAKIFGEIVRRLPDNDVIIEVGDNFATTILCEKAKFSIMGKEADDFTGLPFVEKNIPVVISQFALKEIIRQTIFSISDSESNRMMSGECLEIENTFLKLTSLDGHRISIRKIELDDSYANVKVVIPGKTLNEISKILTGTLDSEVEIYFTKNHVLFSFDGTTVVSRLIEGEYFKVEQMLSGDYETKVNVNKRELLNCIDRASLLVKENDKKPLIMGIQDEVMELKLISSIGSLREDITIDKKGKDLLIGFNTKFLSDALRVIDDENITLYMVNPKAPCFIKDERESYIYLVLPVNFNVN